MEIHIKTQGRAQGGSQNGSYHGISSSLADLWITGSQIKVHPHQIPRDFPYVNFNFIPYGYHPYSQGSSQLPFHMNHIHIFFNIQNGKVLALKLIGPSAHAMGMGLQLVVLKGIHYLELVKELEMVVDCGLNERQNIEICHMGSARI